MQPIRRQSVVEQTASHLREGFRSGRWSGYLPGVIHLASELGVSKNTLREVLHQLEAEGLLKDCGAGKRREIISQRAIQPIRKALRVGILLNEPLEGDNHLSQHLLQSIRRTIEAAGHVCFFADKCLNELGHKRSLVARLVKDAKADAWVTYCCTIEVLKMIVGQQLPVCAVGAPASDCPSPPLARI